MSVFVVSWYDAVIGVYSTLELARSKGVEAAKDELWDGVRLALKEYSLDGEFVAYHEMKGLT